VSTRRLAGAGRGGYVAASLPGSPSLQPPRRPTALLGAAFLMATSAVGPGFLTQTTVFTRQLGASFAFAILVSVLFDLAAQLNIWRTVIGAGQPAHRVANGLLPGLGHALSGLVALGGLAFNIGNVAGAGLGLDALLGLDVRVGAALSALLAMLLFLSREAGRAMDRFAQVMGGLMVLLATGVAVTARPPVGEALLRSVLPAEVDVLAIVTIVGGTVGGYITFAGAHRLLDAGVAGPAAVPRALRSAGLGIGVATLMRMVLFLGALGIVAQGHVLDPANPPASVFRHAAGELGYRFFGLVMWAAALTSIVGSAYTSVSFLTGGGGVRGADPAGADQVGRRRRLILGFILVSTIVFLAVGRPVVVLVAVGALNGLILPVGLAAMLVAGRRAGQPPAPAWLAAAGWVVAVAMTLLGAYTLATQIPALFTIRS
jgi:Mn2+/Fe2+ NRAMP family transporter